jgi:hypothetical protein
MEADAVARGAARGEGDVEDDMTPPRRAFPSVAVLLVMSGAAEFPVLGHHEPGQGSSGWPLN